MTFWEHSLFPGEISPEAMPKPFGGANSVLTAHDSAQPLLKGSQTTKMPLWENSPFRAEISPDALGIYPAARMA